MLLKEFITQVRGVSYKPTNILSKGMGIPILRANNIKDGKINLNDLIYIDKAVIKKEQILKSGDIVLCTSSGSKDLVGKAATFNGSEQDISFGAFCKVVRVIDCGKINKDFIRLFFQSPTYKKQIADSSIGANINNIKAEHIDNLSIYIPSIKAQNRAVKEINVLIEYIDGLEKKLSYLDELIKSRFNEMFSPFEQQTKCMNEVCSICRGASPRPISAYVTSEDDGVSWIKIGDVGEDDIYITSTSERIKKEGA